MERKEEEEKENLKKMEREEGMEREKDKENVKEMEGE